MKHDQMLDDAQAAPPKPRLEDFADAVHELRGKGYSWRDIADFLNERGVKTDHTRVYRTFVRRPIARPEESRPITVLRVAYRGERTTKGGRNSWTVLDIELPSAFEKPLSVVGYSMGIAGAAGWAEGDEIESRDSTLVVKAGTKFPLAFVRTELRSASGEWTAHEIYIVPDWEVLLGG